MPRGGVYGRSVRAKQTRHVQAVELADINAPGFNAAGHEEEKVATIGEELRGSMTPLLRRLDSCRGSGFTTPGRYAENRLSGDQNGRNARSVPANGRADAESNDRSHN